MTLFGSKISLVGWIILNIIEVHSRSHEVLDLITEALV